MKVSQSTSNRDGKAKADQSAKNRNTLIARGGNPKPNPAAGLESFEKSKGLKGPRYG